MGILHFVAYECSPWNISFNCLLIIWSWSGWYMHPECISMVFKSRHVFVLGQAKFCDHLSWLFFRRVPGATYQSIKTKKPSLRRKIFILTLWCASDSWASLKFTHLKRFNTFKHIYDLITMLLPYSPSFEFFSSALSKCSFSQPSHHLKKVQWLEVTFEVRCSTTVPFRGQVHRCICSDALNLRQCGIICQPKNKHSLRKLSASSMFFFMILNGWWEILTHLLWSIDFAVKLFQIKSILSWPYSTLIFSLSSQMLLKSELMKVMEVQWCLMQSENSGK